MLMNNNGVYQSQLQTIAVVFMGAALLQINADKVNEHHTVPVNSSSLRPYVDIKTYNQPSFMNGYIDNSSYKPQKTTIHDNDSLLRASVSTFYQELQSKQELLGKDFENILIENIWDLYLD